MRLCLTWNPVAYVDFFMMENSYGISINNEVFVQYY